MQQELDGSSPPTRIQIFGVNHYLSAAGNPTITNGRDLPWLQDEPAQNVWALWGVDPYDVVVLDGDNAVVSVFSVLTYDLSVPANYDALKTRLLDTAIAEGN